MPDLALSARQRTIVRGTIYEAKIRYGEGHEGRIAAQIAIATMFPESGCRVLASANVPESQKYPYDRLNWTFDGLGHDHASMGGYQQQTGTAWTPAGYGYAMNQTTMNSPNGWGTPKELMTPATAAGKFFKAMDHHHPNKSWLHKDRWVVAQNVQGSAYDGYPRASNNYSSVYGGNYKAFVPKAILVVQVLWLTVSTKKATPVLPTPKHAAPKPKPKPSPIAKKKPKSVYTTVRHGQTLSVIAHNWGIKDWHKLVSLNSKAHPSLVARPDYLQPGWKLRVR